jgi:2-desacetyl-2-hydroxyethyl bacteriochlorophyllide A dehydrogenase
VSADPGTMSGAASVPRPSTARVAVVTSPGTLEIETRPVREPGEGEALIRVRDCGICGSDLKLYSGKHPTVKPPMVLGHEFHGSVEAVGPGAGSLEPGASVAVFPPRGCGECYSCRRGYPHLCPDMAFIGGEHQGGLSELVAVPAENALAIDQDVPVDRRVFIEPLAVGVHAVSRAQVAAGDRVLVIGAGAIGLFTALALRHRGVESVLLTDLSGERLALVRRLGAGDTFNTREGSVLDRVRETVRPEGVDVAFDCVGMEATAADALASTCKGGRTVLVGMMPSEMRVDGVLLQRGERALIGVQQYTREDFATAMAVLAAGALPDSETVTRTYALEDVAAAFEELQKGRTDVLKYVVRP